MSGPNGLHGPHFTIYPSCTTNFIRKIQGRSQGGDMGVRTPHWPKFYGHFCPNSYKMYDVRASICSASAPSKTPLLAISEFKTPSLGHFWLHRWLNINVKQFSALLTAFIPNYTPISSPFSMIFSTILMKNQSKISIISKFIKK